MRKVQSNNWPSEPAGQWEGLWICTKFLLGAALFIGGWAFVVVSVLRMLGIIH